MVVTTDDDGVTTVRTTYKVSGGNRATREAVLLGRTGIGSDPSVLLGSALPLMYVHTVEDHQTDELRHCNAIWHDMTQDQKDMLITLIPDTVLSLLELMQTVLLLHPQNALKEDADRLKRELARRSSVARSFS